jgi:hypothetical protein
MCNRIIAFMTGCIALILIPVAVVLDLIKR